jgi:4-hydroxybenzoate polyprenyltransferase
VIRAARLVLMMIRPPVAAVLLLFAALGLAPAGRANALHPLFTTILVIVGGWFINATVLNDLADEDIDRINLQNARGRPLVSGDATRRELLAMGLAAGVAALAMAWMVGWRVGIVVTIGLALNVAYSMPPLRLSARGLVALALLPLGYVALPFLVGAYSAGPSLGKNGLALLFGLYVTFIGRIALKDFRDVRGDELFGKRTFLVRRGRRSTCVFSGLCWLVGSAALLAIVPIRSFLFLVFVAYLACVLHGLRSLMRAGGYAAEQVIIGAIAQIGRGMAITLLAHFTMVAEGWSFTQQSLVTAALALMFVGIYREIIAEREAVPLAAVRPY